MTRLLVLAFLVACGGGGAARAPTFAQTSRLPASVTFVAGFDVDKFKQTPFWKKVGPSAPNMLGRYERRNLDQLKSRCDIDPFRDLHWVVYAVEGGTDLDAGVAIVGVSFDRNKLDRCAAQFESRLSRGRPLYAQVPVAPKPPTDIDLGEDPEVPPRPPADDDESGPFRRYGDFWIGWIGTNTAVIATSRRALPLMRTLIDGKGGGGNPDLHRVLATVDHEAIGWVAGVGKNLRQIDPINTDTLEEATSLSGSLRLGSELRLRFSAEQTSRDKVDERARRLEKRLHRKLEDVAFLDRWKVSAVDKTITAELVLDSAAIDIGAGMIVAEGSKPQYKEAPAPAMPDEPAPPAPPSDSDSDGLTDDRDQCPMEPEDKDGFEDDNGCPDPDDDHDGITDINDRCRHQAENKNGYQDEDGCPDEDPKVKQAQEEANRVKASSRTQQGMAYLKEKLYDKALEEFRAAYALVPLPKLIYNMAVAHDGKRDRQAALDAYKKYVDAEPTDKLAAEARKRIAALTKELLKK